ncbi:Disulfide bonded thioredoxin protein [Agrobacterium tumefaciens str. Cherry 2E-2-2]|nr:Disulfide bonded thioredoxin protein [Agrobacterium tumefaciens str. Cherry 2E-2-2]
MYNDPGTGLYPVVKVDDILIQEANAASRYSIAAAVNSNNRKISALLDRNYRQALAFNFVGTPSFVIGKTIYPGVLDEKGLKAAIKQARS